MSDRAPAYDVVLWGATGFTGRLVAEHLAGQYDPSDLDWAIAGRNPEKLEGLREDLAEGDPECASLDVLTGDAFERESLTALADRTRVVCSTVGPYAEYGSTLVSACVETGTDYCDLAGEIHWIRQMIDRHHEDARRRGVRIVHACGYDSIPTDLGTVLVQQRASEAFGRPCETVRAYASSSSFELSGGTLASMRGMYEAASADPDVRRVIGDPHSLAPGQGSGETDVTRRRGPGYDGDVGQWVAPSLLAFVNEKIVHRTNALRGAPWGSDFRYREVSATGAGLAGAVRATTMSAGLALYSGTMSVSPLRNLADRFVLPDPGEGPDRETIEQSDFEVRLLGTGSPSGDEREGAVLVDGAVTADRDPGYGATSRMVGEAAVCLATGDTDTPLEGGVLTPATGIGPPLVDRLRDVGMTFDVDHTPIEN